MIKLWHLWIIWGYIFNVIELPTLMQRPPVGDTIFQHLWKWLDLRNKTFGYNARRSAWVVGQRTGASIFNCVRSYIPNRSQILII